MSTSKSSIVAICVVLFTTASWKFKARDIETNEVYQRTIDELVHDYDQRLKEQNEMHNMQMGNLTKKYGELLTAQVEDHEKQIANLKKTHAEELNLSRKELRSTLTENCKHQLDTKNNHAKSTSPRPETRSVGTNSEQTYSNKCERIKRASQTSFLEATTVHPE